MGLLGRLNEFIYVKVFFFFFFFFLQLHLWHVEVAGLGVQFELQMGPMPQPWQHWIWATSMTYDAACGNTRSLTHWVRPGNKPAFFWALCHVLNPLSHNGNTPPFFFFSFLSFVLLGPHPQHMEVSRLGVQWELQLPAYTRATAAQDPSHVCNLHHSSWQRWILNPLRKARE